MSDSCVRVGLVQHRCGENREENLERAIHGLRQAKKQGAEVVCLQELFGSTYFCQVQDPAYFELAEETDGPTALAISKVCKELELTALAGFFERRAPGLCHNSLLVIGPNGDRLGLYRKMHIPEDPQFEEKFYFAPGDLGFMSVKTPAVDVGPLICWDQWYPEAARLTAMQGAQILFYPTAIGRLPEEKDECGADQLAAWQTIQRSHAIANGVFTVSVNRVGTETSAAGSIEFWGHSFVCSPTGAILAQASTEEEVLVVECDLTQVAQTRRIWPFFRDRRIDGYGDLTKRWST